MGLRFRKSAKVMPGVKINLTKNGISSTIGPKGTTLNINKKGVYGNLGISGTGLYAREKIISSNDKPDSDSDYTITDTHVNTVPWILVILVILIGTWFIGFTASFIIGVFSGILFRFKLRSEQKKQLANKKRIPEEIDNDDDIYEGDVCEENTEEDLEEMDDKFKSVYNEVSRKRRAMDKKYIPLTLDKEDKTATFQGSSGEIYTTTLDSCTCIDFAITRGAKCKHIYRLEHELGICDLPAITPKESKADALIHKEADSLLKDIAQYWEFMPLDALKIYMRDIESLKLQQEQK